jgi:hypothetical protein
MNPKPRLDTFDVDQCQSLSDRQSLFLGRKRRKGGFVSLMPSTLQGSPESFAGWREKSQAEHARSSFLELARCYDALANNEEADRATQIGSTGRG